jgi:hypothetical protein
MKKHAGGAIFSGSGQKGRRAMESAREAVNPEISNEAYRVYQQAALALTEAGLEFLVGGTFALAHYTPTSRNTKDFDLFVRPQDLTAVLDHLRAAGFSSELPFPHWLGKAYRGDIFIDIIFSSGNGVARVDDEWFAHAQSASVFGLPLPICPAEEMIWSKAFVLERERFDGADVLHLIRDRGAELDWDRLLRRFGRYWRVLYAHLILFGFVFPGHRRAIPDRVMQILANHLRQEQQDESAGLPSPVDRDLCQGTLLSREQYLTDIEQLGYRDARLYDADLNMSEQDIARWTGAIPGRKGNGGADPRGDR